MCPRLVRGAPDFSGVAAQLEARAAEAAENPSAADVPIVMILLDEFGLTALLDESEAIDSVRYR